MEILDSVRLDKWLWAARFFKSRTLAAASVEAGRVLINGERAKPARAIRVDDRLVITRDQERLELFVRGITETRRSAPLARLLYDETPDSITERTAAAERRRLYSDPSRDIEGRPTKRDRRMIQRLRDRD
ncbi:MAG: RNA-binding S4 domain-containing protein [Burkholderiaceae bacterium]|nr:RNA-binding S4 domain-containing protein [Burkholderiaceae bacterium]